MSTEVTTHPALTLLSEEEEMFRDAVRDFAQGEIAPRARAMEEAGHYDADLLPKLFEMGLMAVDVPESYGGAGGNFFQSILAVEEVSRADAAVGVLVDVQNTLVHQRYPAVGIRRSATVDAVYRALASAISVARLRAVRSRLGLGCVRPRGEGRARR